MRHELEKDIVAKLSTLYIEVVSDIIYNMTYKELMEIPIIEYEEPVYSFIKNNCIKFTGGDGNDIYSMGTYLFRIINKDEPSRFVNTEMFAPGTFH